MPQNTKLAQHGRTVSLPAGGASTTSNPIDSQEQPFPEITPDYLFWY